jgi:hypothetical protein
MSYTIDRRSFNKKIGDLKVAFFILFQFEVDQFFFRNGASLLIKSEFSIFLFQITSRKFSYLSKMQNFIILRLTDLEKNDF